MSTVLAFLSALSYGIGDFSGGLATRRTPVVTVVFWSQAAGLVCAAAMLVFTDRSSFAFSEFLWGAAAGLGGAAGLAFLYKGIAKGLAAVVSPSAALVSAVMPALFGLILGERPPLTVWLGMALAIPAIILLSFHSPQASEAPESPESSAPPKSPPPAESPESSESEKNVKKSLRYGILAGLGFGAFFILISRSGSNSGFWPLIAARSASIPVFFLIAAMRRCPLRVEHKSRLPVLATGILDMSANMLYILAVRSGMLITTTIMAALYPAPTVLLQWLVFGEKPGKLKLAGLCLTIAGMILISTGG